jgi:uncharacterized membrane protein YdbT with pleckstrin-like domain
VPGLEGNLISGEAVIYRGCAHWIVLVRSVTIAVFLAALGAVMLYAGTSTKQSDLAWLAWASVAPFCVAAGFLIRGIWQRRATEFAVTNKRVIIRRGMLQKRTEEILLPKVESISADQGLLGRMLGYGTLTVRGTGGTFEPVPYVPHALEFRRQVLEQISGTH